MATLKDRHRVLIIKLHAQFVRPGEIRDALKEVFSIDVGIKQICDYNPAGHKGHRIAKKWKELFEIERSRFKEEANADEIDIFNRTFRLREMSKNYHEMINKRNIIAAQQILEQAAKEAGHAYAAKISDSVAKDDIEKAQNHYTQINQFFNVSPDILPAGVEDAKQVKETKG